MTIAVISDISPDSGYPNLCTQLGTAHHPKPFRHTSLDRWIGDREKVREGERLGLDALPKRDGWNEGVGREIVKERGERERERGRVKPFRCAVMETERESGQMKGNRLMRVMEE